MHNKLTYLLSIFIIFSVNSGFSQTKRVHNFPIYDVDDRRFVLYDLLKAIPNDGVLILNFTSIYCHPCKREIPELLRIAKKCKNRVNLFFIYSEYDRRLVNKNATELGIKINVCIDLFGTIKSELGIKKSLPYTILINQKGYILGRFDGYSKDNTSKISKIACGGR